MDPAGGTELQLKFLYDHVDNDLLAEMVLDVVNGKLDKKEIAAWLRKYAVI